MNLKIIHTNDLHSHFENFLKVASVIKENREEQTLLLDGGDFADFKAIELRGTKGMAAVELLETVGYDALTIGNNEMFNGVEILEYMASQSSIPFISNNLLKKDGSPIEGVLKSTIVEKNGLRILITGSSPNLGGFNEGLGVSMGDFKNSVKSEIQRNKGNYDLCLLLSHVGTEIDDEMAREIPGIHIILSAHDHQLYLKPKWVNGVLRNSAGNYGEHVGILEVEFTNGKLKLLQSKMIPTASAMPNEKIQSILAKNKELAVRELNKPLYSLERPLWHDVLEENPLSNLIADGLKDMMDCDFSIINGGIANAGIFDCVSEKKLIEVSPSPLNPTSFEIEGKYIREALQQSLDSQICLSDGRGPGFRGKFVGRLHVSGLSITHDELKVLEVAVDGEPLEDERVYTVASSDYLQRGSGYPSLANNTNEKYLPEEIRDVIRTYAKIPEFLRRAFDNRWFKN